MFLLLVHLTRWPFPWTEASSHASPVSSSFQPNGTDCLQEPAFVMSQDSSPFLPVLASLMMATRTGLSVSSRPIREVSKIS